MMAEMLRVSELEFLQQQKEVIEERISRLQGAQSEEPRVHTAKKPLPAATLEVERKMGVITQDVTVRKHGLPTTNGTSKKSQEQKSGTTGRQKPNGGSEKPHNNIVETEHSSVTSESGSGSGSGSAPSASIFGRVTNLFSHGPNQADEIRRLQEEMKILSAKLQTTEQLFEKEQAEKETLSNLVMELNGQRKGYTTAGAETHSTLEAEYKSLFDYEAYTAAQHLVQSTQGKVSSKEKERVGRLFYETYETCKAAILNTMFTDVFQPSHGVKRPSNTAKDRAGVYGVCIATTPALCFKTEENKLLLQNIFDKLKPQLTAKVVSRVSPSAPQDPLSQAAGTVPEQPKVASEDPLEIYLKKAIIVAWKMLTIQPPMIVTFPSEENYNPVVHDKDTKRWSSKLKDSEYDLVFFKPAVYYTFEEKKPVVKAEVGNRKRKASLK